MGFKWSHLLSVIEGQGYNGPKDDLTAVKSFLSSEGMDTDKIEVADGKTVHLDELFASRDGKPLNAADAFEKAQRDAEVDQIVAKRLEAFRETTGINATPKAFAHDVKVGRDRVGEDPKGGFKHFGDYLGGIVKAGTRDSIAPPEMVAWQKASLSTYGSEGIGADGGFAIPGEFRENITSLVQADGSLMSRCDQLPITKASISLPDDETTPWGSDGIRSFWEGEAGAQAQSKPSLKSKDFRLRKLTTLVPLTEELLEDSVALGSYVERVAPERINWEVDEAIVRGTGAGQPLGYLNSDATISVTKEGSQLADTIVGQNIVKMYARLYSRYRADAVWLISHDAEAQLLKLTHTGTTSTGAESTGFGSQLYASPGMNINGSPYGQLMGRPVIVTEHSAALGDLGDIMLVSLSQYRCVTRAGGIQAAQSMHLWFDQDAVAFKFRMRVDGAPKLSSAITPRSGANTLSPFVTLAARA